MRRAIVIGLVCLSVVFAGLVVVGSAATSPASGLLQAGDVDADRIVLRAAVDDAGDAFWEIEYRILLDTDDRRAGFDQLAADIDANESTYVDLFGSRMATTAAAASGATGREMRIENVSVETETTQLPQPYGIVRYRFEWSGFAAVDGETLTIGDALDGLFLDAESRLMIEWPNEYECTEVVPTPDAEGSNSVTWNGPVEFGGGEPRLTVARPGLPWTALTIGAGVILLSLGGALWLRRDDPWLAERFGGAAAATADRVGDDPSVADDVGDADTEHAADCDDDDPESPSSKPAGTDDPPEELLSNEERVLRLLEANGGRMKQQQVVAELGWTEARTSQVVTGLRDEGKLEGFRLGRENVLRLPEEDD